MRFLTNRVLTVCEGYVLCYSGISLTVSTVLTRTLQSKTYVTLLGILLVTFMCPKKFLGNNDSNITYNDNDSRVPSSTHDCPL
jgi:hypothetical protein